ncbi:MAG: TIGR04282 family arsenosugar biosynthesis glycosyltransferase [Bryobacterales bacterium]|nr:TIGR04282 family arsenosugar biosynthesis glycosyltransferase [Bryobacterales bacterium]
MIAVFAKAPRPGEVKTRLAAAVGDECAAGLHRAFVADVLATALSLGEAVELHTDRPTEEWAEFRVARRLQVAGDLGTRLLHVLRTAAPALIIGSDVPSIPASHLRRVLDSTADLALGPAEDGGYWAIRARKAPGERLFRNVAWSSGRELEQTVMNAREDGLDVEIGPEWYDVDTVEEFRRLLAGWRPPHTSRFLRLFGPLRV